MSPVLDRILRLPPHGLFAPLVAAAQQLARTLKARQERGR